jgi:hypothetical protein
MNVRPVGQFLQFVDELLKLLAIEFVITNHVDDGSVRRGFQGPLQTVSTRADVPGKNHGLSLNSGRRERLKFQMQIAKNVEAHLGVSLVAPHFYKPSQITFLLDANWHGQKPLDHFRVRRRVQGGLRRPE